MHNSRYDDYDIYDTQGYELPSLPYIPYASSSEVPPSPPSLPVSPSAFSYNPNQQETSPSSYQSWPTEETPPFVPTYPQQFPIPTAHTLTTANATEPMPTLPATRPKKRRRGLWIGLGVVVALLVLAASAFGIFTYLNRSTPLKTMDAFCTALQHEDYKTAYNQFSKQLQGQFTEAAFADVLSQDKVITCSHGTVNANGDSATATSSLKLVHNSKGVNTDKVTLVKDTSSNWKIDDLQKV